MSTSSMTGGLLSVLIGLGSLAAATSASSASDDGSTLSEASMAGAIRYLGVLAGRALPGEDEAWLKRQWRDEQEASPRSVAAEVDDLAFSFERYQRDGDPVRLAKARATIVKSTYCTAEQSSDPTMHRLRDILAPADLVLASDCILGLVVTPFDVDGLVASHALTASATGQSHDAETDRADIVVAMTEGFAAASSVEKNLLANGELRHAVLARFWALIEGSPEQAAVVQELRSAAAADLKAPARRLETLALSKLAEIDYLARVGDVRLTAGAMATYHVWLERIAGYSFDSRDRDWFEQAIIWEFKEHPKKVLDEVASIEVMNRDYVLTKTLEEKTSLLTHWAASLHCYLSTSDDPDEVRLAEIVFQEDPVIDADCEAGTVRRQRHTVLAEAGGKQLLEQDLETAMRFAAMILGRPLFPEEEAMVRDDKVQSFQDDPGAWQEEAGQYQALLANVEKYDTSAFLGMDERKKLFDPIYCALKTSDEPYAADYLAMFERSGAILFEDCDQQLVTTEEEIQAVVSVANFLALLSDEPPLDAAKIEEIRDGFKSQYMGRAESSMLALREWWSLLSLEERAAEAQNAKTGGITIDADAETIAGYVEKAKLQVVLRNARIDSCRMSAIIVQGQTAIFGAKHGPYTASTNNPLGISGQELGGLIATSNALGELCKDVLGG